MTYSDKKKNIYNFEIMSDSVNLLSDVIEFKPDSEINCQQKEMDSVSYDDCLITQISVLLKFMDSYQIRDASAEFSQFGIDLKLYLYSGKEIVYVSNPHKVIKSEWKNYLQELTKIDENWYYSE
jgi:hypothetical protein